MEERERRQYDGVLIGGPRVHKELGLGIIEYVDLSNRDLEGIDFSNREIKYVNFKGANLKNADFTNVIFENVIFDDAHVGNADFRGSNIAPYQLMRIKKK